MSLPISPIVLFVYNRPGHLKKTLKALAKNKGAKDSCLFIYSDGPRSQEDAENVTAVRDVLKDVQGFQEVNVVTREENWGLARSILKGVEEVLERSDRVIVLEDDLSTHPSFLTYMNGALEAYASEESILSVSGYLPPRWKMPRPKKHQRDVWLNPRNLSFGWGTWKRAWQGVDWEQAQKDHFATRKELQTGFAHGGDDLPGMLLDQLEGKIDSWAVRFSYAHYRKGAYSLMPVESYVKPLGYDGSGVHCRPNPVHWFEHTRRAVVAPRFPQHPEVDQELTRALRKCYARHHRLAKCLGISR
ncbi:glycosyltransferase [Kiritimatiellota bacterium B12222]|nr:glycosyltransferase [Kiritimatiellota bacterium B12222]